MENALELLHEELEKVDKVEVHQEWLKNSANYLLKLNEKKGILVSPDDTTTSRFMSKKVYLNKALLAEYVKVRDVPKNAKMLAEKQILLMGK
jgi:hypothetical protein